MFAHPFHDDQHAEMIFYSNYLILPGTAMPSWNYEFDRDWR